MSHERRVLWSALAAGAPGGRVAGAAAGGRLHAEGGVDAGGVGGRSWLGFAFAVRGRVVRPLQTVSNLLAALREGDYSFRARGGRGLDALSEVIREINALSQTMREQRMGALEATALLRTVMAEIDVAVFAFDPERRLRFVNRAGERLLGRTQERAAGRTAEDLGLEDVLRVREAEAPHTLDQFQIVGKKDLFPNQLSGGQQQLAAVARAVIHGPKLILADEPTGNLHSSQGREIMKLFKRLNRQGVTIIQVTHSEVNASYGNRVAQLADGWVVGAEQGQATV